MATHKELSERARWRMQMVLTLRYLHGLTLEETGERLGVTRERVRQIETLAIRFIRAKPELMEKIRDLLSELDATRPLPADLYMGSVVVRAPTVPIVKEGKN